jgi:hypothetical protein
VRKGCNGSTQARGKSPTALGKRCLIEKIGL